MEHIEFEIKKIGTLKYSRLKSLSILRKEINCFGYNYTMIETKYLLDSLLNNKFEECFNWELKICFDQIFDKIEYIKYDNDSYKYDEQNFPVNWIPPIG